MKKSELIEIIAEKEGIPRTRVEHIVNAILGGIMDGLAHGERIEIRGFGSFTIRQYNGYTGRNPRSGSSVFVSPKKLPYFKVGKELREAVNTKTETKTTQTTKTSKSAKAEPAKETKAPAKKAAVQAEPAKETKAPAKKAAVKAEPAKETKTPAKKAAVKAEPAKETKAPAKKAAVKAEPAKEVKAPAPKRHCKKQSS